MAQNRLDHQRCVGCGLLHDEVDGFLDTHHLELWRCFVCERRDAETAAMMKKKQLKHGLQLRWFLNEEEGEE